VGLNLQKSPQNKLNEIKLYNLIGFLRCSRAAQMHLTGHMQPAGRVFETHGVKEFTFGLLIHYVSLFFKKLIVTSIQQNSQLKQNIGLLLTNDLKLYKKMLEAIQIIRDTFSALF
jgi:hypothetical protein